MRSGVDVFDNGVFFGGIKVRGFDEDAVDVGLAIAAFGDEAFGHGPASGEEFGSIGFFQFADEAAIAAAAQFVDGRHIGAGPGVDEAAAVGGELDVVIAIALSELLEAAAIKVHPAEVEVVGVFVFAQTAGEEPDLALGIIDMKDFSHGPCALGDLVFSFAGFGVVQVEVAPAVAFAHPEEFAGGVQPVTPGLLSVVDEGLGGFFDDDAHGACFCVCGQDAVKLMTALIVIKVELTAVWGPRDFELAGLGEGVLIEFRGHANLPTLFVSDDHLRLGQGIAGLDVLDDFESGLNAIFG